MPEKMYSNCPTCGCNVQVLAGSVGTSLFKSVDIKELEQRIDILTKQEKRLKSFMNNNIRIRSSK